MTKICSAQAKKITFDYHALLLIKIQKSKISRLLIYKTMAFIKGSVGIGGNNAPGDVRIIQWLLIRAGKSADFMGLTSAKLIKENGVMDFATQIAIKEYTLFANRTFSFLTFGISGFSSQLIFPDDVYYNWLLGLVVSGNCFFTKTDFENDPRLKQARDGRIAFWQFKWLVENTQCKVLSSKGIECQNLLKEPKIKAFLDMLAFAEGTDKTEDAHRDGYDTGFNYRKISVLQHPGRVKGGSAAGRYQAMPDSWQEAQKDLGLFDFTPESQDIFAVWRMKYARNNMTDDVLNDRFAEAVQKGCGEWASLPDKTVSDPETNPQSKYFYKGKRQPAKKLSKLWEIYQFYLKQY